MPAPDISTFYDAFNAPVTDFDCGALCSPHNLHGIPFCCDICHSVPAAWHAEWDYLNAHTDLWHAWRGDECSNDPVDPATLADETPEHMRLLACLGPAHCQREYRCSSCRQFPFFPYINLTGDFIGLAYNWDFEPTCWVISHLDAVTPAFRREFVAVYDDLLRQMPEEYQSYLWLSEDLREAFSQRRRRFALLHRNGTDILVSPLTERMMPIAPGKFPRFGPYKGK